MLNQEQQKAVDKINGPILIIAGAGSGKTTTLINRTANIISSGVDPANILLLTFTNKAAEEMKIRGTKMLDDRFDTVTACTYHSFCTILLRRYSSYLGQMGNFVILDQATATETIKLIMSKIDGTDIKGFPHASTIASIISSSLNLGISLQEALLSAYEKYAPNLRKIEEIQKAYNDYKIENNQMDYDDLMLKCIDLLQNHKTIREVTSSKYQYIMVDEYQDSNSIQLKLLKLLCNNKPQPNICVVGDDQQSIYLFRGAQFLNIINYPKEFPGCEIIILDKNYRSNQEILDLSNSIIEDAPEKYEKNLKGFKTKGEKPQLVISDTSLTSASFIIKKIKEYKSSGLNYSDITILSRGSRTTGILEGKLTTLNIPYDKYGGIKFNERALVQDITALLKISVNPLDEVAWFRWLQLYPSIGAKTAHNIFKKIYDNKDTNVLRTIKSKKTSELLNELADILDGFKTQPFDELYETVCEYYFKIRKIQIEAMKNDARTQAQGIETAEDILKNDKEDCKNILNVLAAKYNKTVDFIADLALNNSNTDESDDKVVVSTVHSIKGLEFKVVFVFECVEGSFPFVSPYTALGNDEEKEDLIANNPLAAKYAKMEMEEERRILYVALTRAKDDLYIMFPQIIMRFGGFEEAQLNRYLVKPLEDGLLKTINI